MTKTQLIPRVERIAPQILQPEAKLWIPRGQGEIAFAHPTFGPDTDVNLGKQILGTGVLRLPTAKETMLLAKTSYERNEKEFQNIQEKMRNRWFYLFKVNRLNDKGTYVVDDLQALRRNQTLNEDKLSPNGRLSGFNLLATN